MVVSWVLISAEAGFDCFMDFLERGFTRDFRDDVLLLQPHIVYSTESATQYVSLLEGCACRYSNSVVASSNLYIESLQMCKSQPYNYDENSITYSGTSE